MCFMEDATEVKWRTECVPGKGGWYRGFVATRPVKSYLGLRLFCFIYYMEDTVSTPKSYDFSLIRTRLFLGAGVSGWPKWGVYSDVEKWITPGPPELNTIKVIDS